MQQYATNAFDVSEHKDRSRRLRIVIGAHTPHGTPYVVGSHHLAREFKRMGHAVFHIPLALGPQDLFLSNLNNVKSLRWAGWKTTRKRLDPANDDQFLLSYLPWALVRHAGFRQAERVGFGALTSPRIESLAHPDLLIVDHPKQFWLVNRLKPRLLIYRPTDAYSYPGHKDDTTYRAIERWLLSKVDGVVLTASETSSRMLSLCSGFAAPPIRVLENGVDWETFSTADPTAPPVLNGLARPRLLYIGTFDDRIDYDFIVSAARQLPQYCFVLGGPMTPAQAARFHAIENITLLGGIPYRELSRFMGHCDLGFMPLNRHPFNATRSPMKLYEFAASGLPMVTRATPELLRRNLPFCFTYDTLSDFSRAVEEALIYKASGTVEMHELARQRSWTSIASKLLAFCDELKDRSHA